MSHRQLQLRPERKEGEHGFTLIELLVVVVIIGILIAIAIPVYLSYQKGAKDKSAQSDLHNAIGVLELCNSDNGTYPTNAVPNATKTAYTFTGTPACTQTATVSGGTTLTYATPAPGGAGGAAGTSYILRANNSGGKVTYYCYNSAVGGAVKSVANATTLC